VDLRLVKPADAHDEVTGEVYVPPASARHVVISDIDDTVMDTGVANKAKMLWRLFVQRAQQRIAFPGVGALYRAFHDGPSGDEQNPLLYVSRGPWSIYEMLVEFFRLNHIPVGPILFLREWGLSIQRPLPQRSENHKLDLVRDMLSVYHDRPFVLIGDSGQHDPEIYTQIIKEHPGRVEAVYIRNVSNDPAREDAIERLAEQVAEVGSSLLLAADTYAMAEHAAEHDLIAPEALSAILEARRVQQGDLDLKATEQVERPTPGRTKEAVKGGELDEALDTPEEDEAPPNVLVEPESTKPR
jgi:phosphatidate phosphatase APP1